MFDILINLAEKNNQNGDSILEMVRHVSRKASEDKTKLAEIKLGANTSKIEELLNQTLNICHEKFGEEDANAIVQILEVLCNHDVVKNSNDYQSKSALKTIEFKYKKGFTDSSHNFQNDESKHTKLEISHHNNHLNTTMRKFYAQSSPLNKCSTTSGMITNFHGEGIRSLLKDPKFPFARIAVDITLTTQQINKAFITVAKQLGFKVQGSESDDYIHIEKKHINCFKCITDCFKTAKAKKENKLYTSISLSTRFSEASRFERVIEVVGLAGKNELISEVIEGTYKNLQKHGKKLKLLRVFEVDLSNSKRRDSHSNSSDYLYNSR